MVERGLTWPVAREPVTDEPTSSGVPPLATQPVTVTLSEEVSSWSDGVLRSPCDGLNFFYGFSGPHHSKDMAAIGHEWGVLVTMMDTAIDPELHNLIDNTVWQEI